MMTGQSKTETGVAPGRIQKWIRLAFALVALAALPLRAATFTVALDNDTVELGNTATLTLRFDGGTPESVSNLPTIPGLQFPDAQQPSTSSININGQQTFVVSLTVRPTQPGNYTIPALSAKVGGQTLTSQPVTLKVVRAAAPEPGSEAEQQQLAILRLSLPKKEAFVGETLVVEMQLLIRSGVKGLGGTDLPGLQTPLQLEGCTVGKAVEGPRRQMTLGTTPFTLIPIRIPVTVLKTGPIKVGPLDGAVVVTLPSRQNDPFDGFGFFNSGVQQRVALSAPEQILTVLPLPADGKPASFTGAIGSYQMTVNAGPTNVAVGDPVTIRVQIKGRGALDAFTLPDQPAWKEFKTYPPTVKTETTGDLGLEGTKFFEQIVVPQNTEIKELPQFDFAYFNPETRRYETLHQPAFPIIVRPAGSTPTPTLAASGATPASQKPTQDIVHIKTRLGRASRSSTVWVTQTWFIALQGLPVIALISAVIWRKRSDALANNPRLRRQKQVAQSVNEGLGQLEQLAATGKADVFFALVVRLMQEQIGERLSLPASAITEAVVDEKLRARGLRDTGADLVHELFQSCNQARYAPEESAQKLEAMIPKLKMALRDLQEVRG